MSNIDDVAKLARVSTATVSAVINGREDKVKAKTRRRVLEAVRQLRYEPNLYARSLARGRSSTLGLIISDIVNPFFGEVAQVIQAEAQARGYQVLVSATQFSVDRLSDAVQHMIGMRVDGLAVVTTEMDPSVLEVVNRRGIPVVFEDAGISGERTSNLVIDYEGGIYRAVRCLVELGHDRILFAENYPPADKDKLLSIRSRSAAFAAAVQKFPGVWSHTVGRPGPVFRAAMEIASQALSEFDFTGVVCNSDLLALGLLRGLRRQGKRIPEDISLIGFDNLPWCELSEPPLTSVEISRATIGKAAVESLVNMIENKAPGEDIRVPTDLILRESVGRSLSLAKSAG